MPNVLVCYIDAVKVLNRVSKSNLSSLTQISARAGVGTENILDGYINAIKVLQAIDGNGVLTAAVTAPVKAYLRARPDTIRCVVRMLTQVRCCIRLRNLRVDRVWCIVLTAAVAAPVKA
jgi:hypothetical protein